MLDYLVADALKKVWCSPYQDRQAIIQPARLTPTGGCRDSCPLMWEDLPMPVEKTDYHVYQIGQNFPIRLDLPKSKGLWWRLSDVCGLHDEIVDLYLNDGRQYPRSTSWISRTWDQDYVIAVQIIEAIDPLDTQPLFIRFYDNAYYRSERHSADGGGKIVVGGGIVTTSAQGLTWQREYQALAGLSTGHAYCFHNGYLVSDIPPNKIKKNDVVEYVYDPSITDVLDFPIADLLTYQSTLDGLLKYLIHPTVRFDTIQYRDDLDLWLFKADSSNYEQGVYYHKNQEPAVRMVTHQDYGVPSTYVQNFVDDSLIWENNTDLVLRIHFRKSGYDRPLVFEDNRIKELYKLSDELILRSMIGVNATLEYFQADHLESALYPFIMRSDYPAITQDVVVDAYGYNAISKLYGETPTKITGTDSNGPYVDLPVGVRDYSTVFEYDTNGLLLGWYTHNHGVRYWTVNSNCKLVEAVSGIGSKTLQLYMGTETVQLIPQVGYKFYVCSIKGGEPQNDWKEVGSDSGLYSIDDNGVFTWDLDTLHQTGAVKGDGAFTCYDFTLTQADQLYKFTLNWAGQDEQVMTIPPGTIDLWLNGRALIQNLDYYVKDLQVVVTNKEYLVDGDVQQFTLRGYGFCQADCTLYPAAEVGWIEHGMLSWDDRYNIRDDHVLRIVVDGYTYQRDDLLFSEAESQPQLHLMTELAIDEGRPYCIEEVPVPIRGITPYVTDTLRAHSQSIDSAVSDYMSQFMVPPVFTTPVIIKDQYMIYSPFCSKILYDIINGWFTPPVVVRSDDKKIRDSVAAYTYLLDYDPCVQGVDLRFVHIHPHPEWHVLTVSQNSYAFMERLITLFLNNEVDLTQFVEIGIQE